MSTHCWIPLCILSQWSSLSKQTAIPTKALSRFSAKCVFRSDKMSNDSFSFEIKDFSSYFYLYYLLLLSHGTVLHCVRCFGLCLSVGTACGRRRVVGFQWPPPPGGRLVNEASVTERLPSWFVYGATYRRPTLHFISPLWGRRSHDLLHISAMRRWGGRLFRPTTSGGGVMAFAFLKNKKELGGRYRALVVYFCTCINSTVLWSGLKRRWVQTAGCCGVRRGHAGIPKHPLWITVIFVSYVSSALIMFTRLYLFKLCSSCVDQRDVL